jgi:DNA-binding MarR family transcriptional regulator
MDMIWGPALHNNMHIQVEKILEINRRFSEQVGIEALRPEAKILFTLKTKGSLSVKEAMILSGLSYRGFYIVLARLANSGWITMEADLKDRRVKRILLSDRSFGDYPLRVNAMPYPAS